MPIIHTTLCKKVLTEDNEEDKDTITAGAVATSLSLGLYMCEKFSVTGAKKIISKRMAFPN